LPTCGTVRMRRSSEDLAIALHSTAHLVPGPRCISSYNVILPEDVIPAVNSNFMTSITHETHQIRLTLSDVRPRQERSIQECPQAVVLDDRCTRYFLQEPTAEYAFDCTTGMVRTKTEKKACARIVALQDIQKSGDSFARPSPRVDVDLQGQQFLCHLTDQRQCAANLTAVVVEYCLERIRHIYARSPVEIALRVLDLWNPVLHILIPLPVVFA